MPPNEGAGNLVYEVLIASGLLGNVQLSHDFCAPSSYSAARPGYAVWRWGQIEPGEKAVLTATYRDIDGIGVMLTVVAGADKKLKEVELWRGDGTPVSSLPTPGALEKMVPGKIYH